MIIIVFKYLTRFKIDGVTLFPFILVRNKKLKDNFVLINHERIHLRQQLELLVLPFYLWYLVELLYRRLQYRSWYLAYRNIAFEREAYENENNVTYIKERLFLRFFKYICCV